MEIKYIISEKRLLQLLEAEARLDALEYGGVDNWEWYSDSLGDYLKNYCDWNKIITTNYDYEQLAIDGLEEFYEYTPHREEDDDWCE